MPPGGQGSGWRSPPLRCEVVRKIQAKFYRGGEGSLHMLLSGHAGAGPKGQDLVCAASSALACTLGRAVERLYEQGMLRRVPKVELYEGGAEIIAVPKERFFREGAMVFWTVQNGIAELAEGFPGNVRLTETMKV